MEIRSEKLRSGREIVIGPDYKNTLKTNSPTVYLGIYNAAPFLDSLLEQIQSQTQKNFPLIVVDNASSDDSWNSVLAWPENVLERAKLVRNPINLGGTGSFALNLDQVQTEWVITMHQDDTYAPNHFAVLNKAIAGTSKDEIVVFSDMGTQDMNGKRIFTPMRQSWVANLGSPQSAFRANLVQQSVSYPSVAFRTQAILPVHIPWHSSSFPDTELTLLQTSKGSFRFIPELTMLYRMNPKSESHDLNPKERVLGPFASLNRVMASDSFLSLCLDVPEKERESFSKAVLEGIDIRLGVSPFSEMVKLVAAETMALAWDYTEKSSREQILATYKLAEDGRTTKLLEELGAFYAEGNSTLTATYSKPFSEAQIELEKLLSAATPPSNAQAGEAQHFLLTLIGRLFPLPIRRKVVAFVVRIYARWNPTSPWNLSWKPKS
jgi:glycosyltransferase involved in cell wall biosynthesis